MLTAIYIFLWATSTCCSKVPNTTQRILEVAKSISDSLFLSGFFGVVAVVLFADYYLWALNTVNLFVGVTTLSQQSAFIINNLTLDSFEYLISEEGYTLTPMLHYSFILEVAGIHSSALSDLIFLFFAVFLNGDSNALYYYWYKIYIYLMKCEKVCSCSS